MWMLCTLSHALGFLFHISLIFKSFLPEIHEYCIESNKKWNSEKNDHNSIHWQFLSREKRIEIDDGDDDRI